MQMKIDQNANRDPNSAYTWANILIIVAFTLLFSRLWYLQITKGKEFKALS